MKTIPLPAGTAYVRVADLLRWIRQTGQDGFWDVYVSDAGEFELRLSGCAPFKNEMKAQFIAFCKRERVEPTSQFDRWEKNYTGEGLQDGVYEVTVSEAERFAAPFGLSFQVDGPASQPQAGPQLLAVLETKEQRQDRRLKACIDAGITIESAPVVVSGKKWTPEKLADLTTYREVHTMPETAEKFGITEQRIRQLLPRKKPKAKPFTGLVHHIK